MARIVVTQEVYDLIIDVEPGAWPLPRLPRRVRAWMTSWFFRVEA